MSLNRYTHNFTTPLETENITGLFPTFGSDSPVLDISAPKVNISGRVGIGTTNPPDKLTVSGGIQIQQDSTSNNRLILRGQPSSFYRWNIDNFGSSNQFRIFREDDLSAVNGSVAVSISTTGTLSATKFSGDGSFSYVGIGTDTPSQKLEVIGGEIKAGRVDTDSEGGQLSFGRATDNNTAWYLDVYGNTSTPSLRFVDVSNAAIRSVIDGAGNFIIGAATSTGTASQPLQVSGGAYVSGSVGIAITTPRAILQLGAGSALPNNAPLKFTTGTNLSSIEAGAVEFDGTTLNFTPNAQIGRASIPTTIYTSGNGTSLTVGSEATSQTLFPSANDSIILPIGTYYLDLNMALTRGTTSVTIASPRIKFAGVGTAAGTFSGISVGSVIGQLGTSAGFTSSLFLDQVNITGDAIIGAAATTPLATYLCRVSGILRITALGSFTPQYSLTSNLTSAGNSTILSPINHMVIRSLATSGIVAATGAWA